MFLPDCSDVESLPNSQHDSALGRTLDNSCSSSSKNFQALSQYSSAPVKAWNADVSEKESQDSGACDDIFMEQYPAQDDSAFDRNLDNSSSKDLQWLFQDSSTPVMSCNVAVSQKKSQDSEGFGDIFMEQYLAQDDSAFGRTFDSSSSKDFQKLSQDSSTTVMSWNATLLQKKSQDSGRFDDTFMKQNRSQDETLIGEINILKKKVQTLQKMNKKMAIYIKRKDMQLKHQKSKVQKLRAMLYKKNKKEKGISEEDSKLLPPAMKCLFERITALKKSKGKRYSVPYNEDLKRLSVQMDFMSPKCYRYLDFLFVVFNTKTKIEKEKQERNFELQK